MTKYLSTPTNGVLVAIDMSKHRQEVLIQRPEGGRRPRMTVMATKDDHDRLVEELTSMARPIVVGDLPLKFHPAAIRASVVSDKPNGAMGATGGNAKFPLCVALESVAAMIPA